MNDNPMAAAAPSAPADRAAELRGVANYLHERGTDLVDGGLTAAADLLRRMADEAQQPEPTADACQFHGPTGDPCGCGCDAGDDCHPRES